MGNHAPNIADRLFNHVFGSGEPTALLMDNGRLPSDWASTYLQLLREASEEWHDQPLWPRQLVSAVHFASWYLQMRYDVWRQRTGSRDDATEKSLAAIRSPSEIFLMRGSLKSN